MNLHEKIYEIINSEKVNELYGDELSQPRTDGCAYGTGNCPDDFYVFVKETLERTYPGKYDSEKDMFEENNVGFLYDYMHSDFYKRYTFQQKIKALRRIGSSDVHLLNIEEYEFCRELYPHIFPEIKWENYLDELNQDAKKHFGELRI